MGVLRRTFGLLAFTSRMETTAELGLRKEDLVTTPYLPTMTDRDSGVRGAQVGPGNNTNPSHHDRQIQRVK